MNTETDTILSPPQKPSGDQRSGDQRSSNQRSGGWRSGGWRLSLRELIAFATIMMLIVAFVITLWRLSASESELQRLRRELGYLAPSAVGQIAATRSPDIEPLTYRTRVRIPEGADYRVCYSTLWPEQASGPSWFAAIDLPPGESVLTFQVRADPRDSRWKISVLARGPMGTKRIATTIPPYQVPIFRSGGETLRVGIGQETVIVEKNQSIRLLDERWLVGEGGRFLYGDRTLEGDLVGVFAELQPDEGPITSD